MSANPSSTLSYHWVFNTTADNINIDQSVVRVEGTRSTIEYIPRYRVIEYIQRYRIVEYIPRYRVIQYIPMYSVIEYNTTCRVINTILVTGTLRTIPGAVQYTLHSTGSTIEYVHYLPGTYRSCHP